MLLSTKKTKFYYIQTEFLNLNIYTRIQRLRCTVNSEQNVK